MVVPSKNNKKPSKPKIKSKPRYYFGLFLLIIAFGMFSLGRSFLLLTGITWFIGLGAIMSSIKWPQMEFPKDESNIIRADKDHSDKK